MKQLPYGLSLVSFSDLVPVFYNVYMNQLPQTDLRTFSDGVAASNDIVTRAFSSVNSAKKNKRDIVSDVLDVMNSQTSPFNKRLSLNRLSYTLGAYLQAMTYGAYFVGIAVPVAIPFTTPALMTVSVVGALKSVVDGCYATEWQGIELSAGTSVTVSDENPLKTTVTAEFESINPGGCSLASAQGVVNGLLSLFVLKNVNPDAQQHGYNIANYVVNILVKTIWNRASSSKSATPVYATASVPLEESDITDLIQATVASGDVGTGVILTAEGDSMVISSTPSNERRDYTVTFTSEHCTVPPSLSDYIMNAHNCPTTTFANTIYIAATPSTTSQSCSNLNNELTLSYSVPNFLDQTVSVLLPNNDLSCPMQSISSILDFSIFFDDFNSHYQLENLHYDHTFTPLRADTSSSFSLQPIFQDGFYFRFFLLRQFTSSVSMTSDIYFTSGTPLSCLLNSDHRLTCSGRYTANGGYYMQFTLSVCYVIPPCF